ncbi:DUF2937 family protein [Stappia sp. ES.058]|uniref:DUF2937 family protein n=1 Tax=Stappia sp. ES.058 TaxID=1881061 RepID=UPI00087B2734|nr:DUF2937 family protein [Stappia sp. ES.058]SDU36650.1 Protein of unknown function [Stappia sp. ES.058]
MIFRTMVLGVAVVSGATTSQLPEFAQQYRQRMGGAIDALSQVVTDFREDATRHGLSVPEALQRLENAQDPLVVLRGRRMEQSLDRLAALTRQRAALQEAGPFGRLGVFVTDLDPQLASATYRDFEPAVPVTMEGAIAAGGGFLAAVFGLGLTGRVTGRMARRMRRRGSQKA